MTHFKNADHFLLMTVIALLTEISICVAYWQGLISIFGLVTAHLGLIWVLAIYSDKPSGETRLTKRHKAQLALTTLLGPIGPLLMLVWLGLVWLQSTVAVRLFGTDPIYEAVAASNKVIEAYRQAEKTRAKQLKAANDILFGDRKRKAQALRSLPDRHDGLFHAQVQNHLQGSDTSLSALAAIAQRRIDEATTENEINAGGLKATLRCSTKEQSLEHARKLLEEHAERLRGGNAPGDEYEREANLTSLLECLFRLGEFETVRHVLNTEKSPSQKERQTDLSKYQAFWQS